MVRLALIVALVAAACGESAPRTGLPAASQIKVQPPSDSECTTERVELFFGKQGSEFTCSDRAGRTHGPWAIYYDGGGLKHFVEYSHGQRNGRSLSFFPDGSPQIVGAYRDGQPSGTWTWVYRGGERMLQVEYSRGRPTGQCLGWWPNGSVREQCSQWQGLDAGHCARWDENGTRVDGQTNAELCELARDSFVDLPGA